MSLNPTTVTGAAVPLLTSPTYTFAKDIAKTANAVRYVVTALGGTQLGVNVHSNEIPFALTIVRPESFKKRPKINALTGVASSPTPKNRFLVLVHKGVQNVDGANGIPDEVPLRLELNVPAGAFTHDPANLEAAISMLFGFLSSKSSDVVDFLKTGLLPSA